MQSDKHLNNMHELQQGNKLLDPNDLIHADPPPPRTPTPKGTGPLPFRCDVCQYETNIARNLRIHMTSEKVLFIPLYFPPPNATNYPK
jgi:hypothetical protein